MASKNAVNGFLERIERVITLYLFQDDWQIDTKRIGDGQFETFGDHLHIGGADDLEWVVAKRRAAGDGEGQYPVS